LMKASFDYMTNKYG